MDQLDSQTRLKMEGKIISYYHRGCHSFVFLGCTPESKDRIKDHKPFNPDEIPGCINAVAPGKYMMIQNLVPSQLEILKMDVDLSNPYNVPN